MTDQLLVPAEELLNDSSCDILSPAHNFWLEIEMRSSMHHKFRSAHKDKSIKSSPASGPDDESADVLLVHVPDLTL
jgi:hypothetical protein